LSGSSAVPARPQRAAGAPDTADNIPTLPRTPARFFGAFLRPWAHVSARYRQRQKQPNIKYASISSENSPKIDFTALGIKEYRQHIKRAKNGNSD